MADEEVKVEVNFSSDQAAQNWFLGALSDRPFGTCRNSKAEASEYVC
jgi:hypothetical protein